MFGDWLRGKRKEYMKKHGVNFEEFSKEIGYCHGYLKSIEGNLKNPPLEHGLRLIAGVLGVEGVEYDYMFKLAFDSRLILERRKIKAVIEKSYGPITQKELNTAIYIFESTEGIIVKLYSGILQETILKRITKYIDRIRENNIPLVPIEEVKSVG